MSSGRRARRRVPRCPPPRAPGDGHEPGTRTDTIHGLNVRCDPRKWYGVASRRYGLASPLDDGRRCSWHAPRSDPTRSTTTTRAARRRRGTHHTTPHQSAPTTTPHCQKQRDKTKQNRTKQNSRRRSTAAAAWPRRRRRDAHHTVRKEKNGRRRRQHTASAPTSAWSIPRYTFLQQNTHTPFERSADTSTNPCAHPTTSAWSAAQSGGRPLSPRMHFHGFWQTVKCTFFTSSSREPMHRSLSTCDRGARTRRVERKRRREPCKGR